MLTQRLSLTNQDARKVSSTQLHRLGSVAETADGRVFRYAKAGAAALAAGKLVVNADLVANHTNVAVAVAAAEGAKEVQLTLGATAATQDQYKDGFLTINDAAGEGIQYAVAGNEAAASSGTCRVFLAEPLEVALTTSSEATLKQNTWGGVVISATDQADQAVGVPNVAVTEGYYFWAQTRGECSVLADNTTVTKGNVLTISAATAGAVGLNAEADTAADLRPAVALASEALVSTEYRAVYLTVD